MIKRLTYFLAILGMVTVALAPAKASAGWGWWGGPGTSIYVGPRRATPIAGGTNCAASCSDSTRRRSAGSTPKGVA